MRLLIHDYAGHAFTAQLARALASRGSDVMYLHGGGLRPPRGSMEPLAGDPPTLQIQRVGINERLHGGAGPRRFLQERRYGALLASRIAGYRPEVVLSVPSSLDAQAAAQRATHDAGAGFVFWLQDLYSKAVERLLGRRLPLAGRLVGIRFARLERNLLRRSDAIVAITDDFLPVLHGWRIPPGRIAVVPNWAPLADIKPLPKVNGWSADHRLADVPVLMYAGTLGRKHDPALLLVLADGLPEARIVVVSEGAGTQRLRSLGGMDRGNLMLLPIQPAASLPEVLATADVLIAILDADAHAFSVPSKVLTYMAAGRPILAAMPNANLAARTIVDAHAGRVVEPADRPGFLAAARALLADPELRASTGAAGRAYAETSFDIERITDRFEAVLHGARPSPTKSAPALDTADTGPEATP